MAYTLEKLQHSVIERPISPDLYWDMPCLKYSDLPAFAKRIYQRKDLPMFYTSVNTTHDPKYGFKDCNECKNGDAFEEKKEEAGEEITGWCSCDYCGRRKYFGNV